MLRLGRIERNVWDVLAVLRSNDSCVLDQLEDLEPVAPNHVEQMFEILLRRVPDSGLGGLGRYDSRTLGDGIFEFCRGPEKGAKIRVAWFYGKPPHEKTVICTDAFHKRNKTPRPVKKRAVDLQRLYLADPTMVTIVELEDL